MYYCVIRCSVVEAIFFLFHVDSKELIKCNMVAIAVDPTENQQLNLDIKITDSSSQSPADQARAK